MKASNILETIGDTPHLRINTLFRPGVEVWIKLERANPGGSIKDRIALAMIEDAEKSGQLKPGGVIIEATSGNTGIGLAMVAAIKKYRLILVMPESMSQERCRVMRALGAELVLTKRENGMRGALERAQHIFGQTPKAWSPRQFENPANPAAHMRHTAQEILADFPKGFDYLITGVGTGGHLSGCAAVLKESWPKLQVLAVEPAASAVISGKESGPHPIQGIGAGFIPKNLKREFLDGVIQVSNEEAFEWAARCAHQEGLFVGPSTGASLAAVAKKSEEIPDGSRILTFNYDSGERYLSVQGLFPQ